MAAMQAAAAGGAFWLDGFRGAAYLCHSEIDVNPLGIFNSRDRKPATFVVDMEVYP
jgi:hypothetical protein